MDDDVFLGEIRVFAGPFVPSGWAACDGRKMQISSNRTLYSVIGSTYGGDDKTYFQLPNLQGNVAIGAGQGTGLSPYTLGQTAGQTDVTLQLSQIPSHNHTVGVEADPGDTFQANGSVLAHALLAQGRDQADIEGLIFSTDTASATTAMSPQLIGATGGSQSHPNVQPSLVMTVCIALSGIVPQADPA